MTSDVAHLNTFALGLKWTRDYPTPGVCFVDTHQLLGDATARTTLAFMARDALPIVNGTVVVAVATRGIALATTIADLFGLPLVVVGEKMKAPAGVRFEATSVYGTKELVIAPSPALAGAYDRPAIVVDDAVESGGTFHAVIAALAANFPHIKVHACVAPVQIGEPDAPLPLYAAFRYSKDGAYLGTGRLYGSAQVVKACGPSLVFCSPQLERMLLPRTRLARVVRRRFPNGDPDIELPDIPRGTVVYYLYIGAETTGVPDDFATELAVLQVLAKYAKHVHVYIPFFPYGTHERVSRPGVLATAETAGRLIGNIRPAPAVTVLDIHALSEQFYFGGDINPTLATFQTEVDANGIVFPDDGAAKRFGQSTRTDRAWRMTMAKQRKGDKRDSVIQDVTGTATPATAVADAEHILLIDDLLRTGGTILEALRLLQSEGARPGSVTVRVTHLDACGDALARFVAAAPPCFGMLRVCGSTPEAERVARHPLFRKRVVVEPFALVHNHPGSAYRGRPYLVLGSTAEAKIAAVVGPYTPKFRVATAAVPSGVPEQPSGDETLRGAERRAGAAFMAGAAVGGCVLGIGLENGLVQVEGRWVEHGAVALVGDHKYASNVFAVPGLVVDPDYVLDPDCTYGKWAQAKYRLPTPASWYDRQGVDRRSGFHRELVPLMQSLKT
jgi:adenine/guanine phosphoribosyltransferase-like PRPP-binding protein